MKTSIEGDGVTITNLEITDASLAQLLRTYPESEWSGVVGRAISVGARGLLTMGVSVDLAELGARYQRVLDEARTALANDFDTDTRSSVLGRARLEFEGLQQRLLEGLDPMRADSLTAQLIEHVTELLGPDGLLETRLSEALDPTADGSAFGRLEELVEERFSQLEQLISHDRGRREEANRGTAKGGDYEDDLELRLRAAAAAIGGCIVERTTDISGKLDSAALVGDFVIVLPNGRRLVVEAKNQATIGLHGKGILEELDRAMANREADFAICVSAHGDAFPNEVGSFGVYGSRLLVTDDDAGVLVSAALRWGQAVVSADGLASAATLDAGFLADRADRVRSLARRLSSAKSSLAKVQTSIEAVRDDLDGTRSDLVTLVDDIVSEIERGSGGGDRPRAVA